MTAYRYEAARADGAMIRGIVDATSGPDAAAVLSGRGLFPVAVRPVTNAQRPWWTRASLRSVAAVFESLASLVAAGVPLEKALEATERIATGDLREAVSRVAARVREGSSLAAALAAEDGLFSQVTTGLVRAGEQGVGLGKGLAEAAADLEARAETAARLRAALAYPMLLAVVGTMSVAFIVLVIVPRFVVLLGDLGQALPLATRVLVAASDAGRRYGLFIGAAFAGAIGVSARLIAERRAAWHDWLLRLPLVGPVRHASATARAARTLGALLATGAPALAALDAAREAAGDQAIAARLGTARDRVAEGSGMASALGATAALTAPALQLAAIGEGSGRLAELLLRAADLEARDTERRIKALVAFAEPALILAFAALVAFVAAALLQAVYSLRPGGI
jgi:type II secretory pathway component PulF